METPYAHVYTDGSCSNNGKPNASAGAGVFWGENSASNGSWHVPGPHLQTNNRAEMYAVLMALTCADPCISLMVFTKSEYVIKHACYWAGKNSQLGWDCPNGDLLKDVIYLLGARLAPTRFIRIDVKAKNTRGEAAKKLAKAGAKLPVPNADYSTNLLPPWQCDIPTTAALPVDKVSTALPEFQVLKPKPWQSQTADDGPLSGNPENHRGREKVRSFQSTQRDKIFACEDAGAFWKVLRDWTDPRPKPVQVSLNQLTEEFTTRMNHPVETPASFNIAQLAIDKELADDLPRFNEDTSPKGSFSRKLTIADIEWGKRHIRKHVSNSSGGVDEFSYGDIMEIPNEVLRNLLQACLDKKMVPSQWMASLVIGILKHRKDPTMPESYRLIVLECCLLKFLTLLIDRRIREYSEDAKLVPASQNGFQETYRTNNNPFILRTMSDRAAAEGKTLYVGYVDLKNAFPATNRDTLWVTLNTLGVKGPLVDWLIMLYDKMSYMVRLNGELSASFESFLGVLTGDPSSPHLWNLFLANFKLVSHPGDITLNGKTVPKLEHADDLLIDSCTPHGFQSKLNQTAKHMANIGCEVQITKCVWAAVGVKPKTKQEFYLDGKLLEEVSLLQYVGIWHDFGAKDMYVQHHEIYTEKAANMANACLAVNRMVGSLSVWDARTLYMARVDPYLISGADICPDVVKSRHKGREDVQHNYLRRVLGLSERSVTAVLFSETGLEPIRYRRVALNLKYLKHLAALDEGRLAKDALLDSLDLAQQIKMSWINDIVIVLADLPIPVYWNVNAVSALDVNTIDELLLSVRHSMEGSIQADLECFSRTRDLLTNRLVMHDGKMVHKVLAFRLYLRVRNNKHRIALTQLVLSSNVLAMERMRWAERYKPQVPEMWRLCRFCKTYLEDPVHALFVCSHIPLVDIRNNFLAELSKTLPDMRDQYTDAGLFFKDLLIQPKVIGLVAKLAFDIVEVFKSEPLLVINPALYTPPY